MPGLSFFHIESLSLVELDPGSLYVNTTANPVYPVTRRFFFLLSFLILSLSLPLSISSHARMSVISAFRTSISDKRQWGRPSVSEQLKVSPYESKKNPLPGDVYW